MEKKNNKNVGVVVVDEAEEKKEMANDDNQDQEKDKDDGMDEEMKMKMKSIKTLLDVVCNIILKEQIPKLWEKRANDFNHSIDQFREKYMMYTLGDDDFNFV
eukprot:CAMPEP_0201567548 /NCGR_PEP_ID=MMETSP0190_2-20130828/8079_1 /ASSEMBLY_ACC=CAM_ASM_000263 /TAXON_ID=37353 /ORGANISM="Rosalina sp." /LENGTH=101 /DNA_ID=CAMNT_0047987659 /DNA_START=761 /DNA_END=1066 /DNA_ORIENTATION=-